MTIYNTIVTLLYTRMYIRFFPVVLCGHGSILMKQLVLCAFVCDQSCECWEFVAYACEKHGISILIGHFWVHSLPTHARVPNTPYSVCQCTLSLKISQLQYVRLYDTKKSGYIPINSCDDMEFFLPLMVYNGITRHHDTHTEFSLGIVFFHYVSVWVTICGCD